MSLAKKNAVYTFNLPFISVNGGFQTNPTIESGDIKVFIDDSSPANIDALPSLATGSSIDLQFELTADEMNGDRIRIECIDQTVPKEWLDTHIFIPTSINILDDVVISSGNINADIKKVDGNATAATALKDMCLTTTNGLVVSDAGNTATTFKTNLSGADNIYGDSNGGSLLAFTGGALAGQSKRITGFVDSTNFITVESAFTGTPSNNDPFIIVGHIEV